MFSSSIVCAVGGIASVSSRAEHRVLVQDVVQLDLEPGELIGGQAKTGEVRDMLDVAAREGPHGTR